MKVRKNLAGQRFGRWVAVELVGRTRSGKGNAIWLFRCGGCGAELRNTVQHLRPDRRSCGCVVHRHGNFKHGHRRGGVKSKEYNAWRSMKRRCFDPRHHHYDYYGGAGITVAEEWVHSFANFVRDVGPCPTDRHSFRSLDRIDNSWGYHKGNVRWATVAQQNNNQTSNILVFVNGETLTFAQACRRYGIKYSSAWYRLERGLSADEAFACAAEAAE
jgi:hypothetical protein